MILDSTELCWNHIQQAHRSAIVVEKNMLNIKVEGKQRGIATHNRMNHPHTSHPANCLIDKSQSGPYIFFYILLLKEITWTYGGKKYQY